MPKIIVETLEEARKAEQRRKQRAEQLNDPAPTRVVEA